MPKVLVIGAGPAGLFAANELSNFCDVEVIEQKNYIGGSGLYSDGKMNFHPHIGGDLTEFMPHKEALKVLDNIKNTFVRHGLKENDDNWKNLTELEKKAAKVGIRFIPIKQAHAGSDYLPKIMKSFRQEMEKNNVNFTLNTQVVNVEARKDKIIAKTTDGPREADYIMIAPGRSGSLWLIDLCKKLNIGLKFNPVDMGVRVEILNNVMKEIVEDYKCWDPKFHIFAHSYDDFVRTFCVCPYGFVVKEFYENNIFGVNGHSMIDKRSNNCNFALLVRVRLTEPLENTTEYGRAIARQTNTLGGGKPIIQRLGDLRRHRRSTWERIGKSYVKPTLKDAIPGDIAMAYPHRIIMDIREALEKLGEVVPGINSDSTLLYGPEIKFYAMRIETNETLQTKTPNIFVAGDGAGVSRGIVGAAATGMIAAKGIKKSF